MDLRSILTEDKDSQPQPQSAHTHFHQAPATPITPAQHRSQSAFGTPNDYPATGTPARQLSHPSQQPQYHQGPASFSGGAPAQGQPLYVSPTQYQGPPQQPPPLQVPVNQELRSPAGSSYLGNSAQSPYNRQTPTSARGSSYPFPPTYQAPQSPAQQQHPYPPTFNPHAVPQTPPVGIPGSTHPYLQTQHQRSHSSISIGTPTSSHSQPPYFNQPATPNPPPSERHSGSERDRSLSVSPKTQPIKRRSDPRVEPSPIMGERKPSKTESNGKGTAVRPKKYPQPPIWAQSIRNVKIQSAAPPRAVKPVAVKAHLSPAAPIKPDSRPNGHGPVAVAAKEFDRYILGGERPVDQNTKVVADWLFIHIVNRDDFGDLTRHGIELEIEAKLGQLNELDGDIRLQIPVASETVVTQKRVGFKSTMSALQHFNLNNFLNAQVQATYPGNPSAASGLRAELKHSHTKQIDRSYDLPPAMYNMLPPTLLPHARNSKLRMSTDKNSGKLVASIIKGRMADLHIFNPGFSLDCRISVSFEMKVDPDSEEVKQIIAGRVDNQRADRDKDRHSYIQPHYQIDHTVAKRVVNGAVVQDMDGPSLEVEIELSTASVREQGQKAARGMPHSYPDLVGGLMDNFRVLCREADRPPA